MIPTHSRPSGIDAAERAYRADIDGLRAVAILSVVFYHAGLGWLPGGFTGVDIFFVISGYLIGGHIYAELRDGAFSYLRFYQRRAKRILPALYAVLAFTLVAALLLLSPAETAKLARDACAATLSVSNVLFWGTTNYFAGKGELNPLLMTWSLGVEEQFYAVIPLLMVLLARIRRQSVLPATLAVSFASLAIAAGLGMRYPMIVFYLLPARAWELGVGVALAVAELNRKSGTMRGAKSGALAQLAAFAGVALVIAPMFLLSAQTAFPVPGLFCSVLGTALLIAVPSTWINRQLLSLLPLTFIGRVSYSWYLWHWPLLALLHIVYGAHVPAAAPVLEIAASFAVAVACWQWIEQPFRRSGRAAGPLLLRYGLVSAALLLVCGVVWVGRGIPQRFPKLAAIETTGHALKADPCLAGSTSDEPNLQPACYAASPAGPTVALWGDSHSAALAPSLRTIASAQGFGFVQLGKAACPPLIGATHFIPRLPLLGDGCRRFNRESFDLLKANQHIRIVVLTADWSASLARTWESGWLSADQAHDAEFPTSDENRRLFLDSLAATLGALQTARTQVIVIEDVPSFEIDPLWRIRATRIPARRRLAALLGIQDATDPGFAAPDPYQNRALSFSLVQQAVASVPGVTLVDLDPALCSSPDQCAYRNGENLLYNDGGHLSTDGAHYALRNFRFPAVDAGR